MCQPAPHGLDDEALVWLVFFAQVEGGGQGGIVGGQCGRFFGADPPDEVVVGGVAVGVFDGQLGLAHAAQAVDGLGEDGRLAGGEDRADLGQEAFPPSPVGVAVGEEVRDQGQARRSGAKREAHPPFVGGLHLPEARHGVGVRLIVNQLMMDLA